MLLQCCCRLALLHPNIIFLLLLEEGHIHTEGYSLLPVDLRDLGALQSSLQSAGFQPDVPTFVLAECVLVYMEPHESAALVNHLGQQLPSAVCVVYEQVHGHPNLLSLQHSCSRVHTMSSVSCRGAGMFQKESYSSNSFYHWRQLPELLYIASSLVPGCACSKHILELLITAVCVCGRVCVLWCSCTALA